MNETIFLFLFFLICNQFKSACLDTYWSMTRVKGVSKSHFTGGWGQHFKECVLILVGLGGGNASQYQTQTVQVHECLRPEDVQSVRGTFKDQIHWFLPPKLYTIMFGQWPSVEHQGLTHALVLPSGTFSSQDLLPLFTVNYLIKEMTHKRFSLKKEKKKNHSRCLNSYSHIKGQLVQPL